ncbi:MAG: 30S ribosomal protein S13 [Promethearchaeota archaeon]
MSLLSSSFRHIIRIIGTDIDGNKRLDMGLTDIPGVDIRLSHAILHAADMDQTSRIGFLSDRDVKKLEDIITDPSNNGIPKWLLNRQKDPHTGEDLHLLGARLKLMTKTDIDLMKKLKTYKGIRHSQGLKVRGQRTRTTGRKGRVVGVRLKKRGAR